MKAWKVVYLWRENVVRHVISGFFAQEVGRYHHRGSERRPKRIPVDPVRFSEWIGERLELLDQERRVLQGVPHQELRHERDLAEPEGRDEALTGVQRYIGVTPAPFSSPLKHSVDRPLSELIENFDEFERHLGRRNSECAELLHT